MNFFLAVEKEVLMQPMAWERDLNIFSTVKIELIRTERIHGICQGAWEKTASNWKCS